MAVKIESEIVGYEVANDDLVADGNPSSPIPIKQSSSISSRVDIFAKNRKIHGIQEAAQTKRITQDWDDEQFCRTYEEIWEISEDEVHYGWLSPGESELGLLDSVNKKNINVLDVGCGLGQNLIALAKQGATCFGVDISTSMLQKAEGKVVNSGLNSKITLSQGDMRNLDCFDGVKFDLILSIYSMEYLSNIQEFRKVISNIYRRLNPGGCCIICFSHHSQASANRYPELMNCSVPIGTGKYRTYNYSYKDAFDAFSKANFTIERVVEQTTTNPSLIDYEQGKDFPYHYREGKNPCREEFDEVSNSNPHTVIFKLRKSNNPLMGIPRQSCFDLGYREIWNEKRTICNISDISYLGLHYKALALLPKDNVIGIVDVVSIKPNETDLIHDKDIEIFISSSDEKIYIPGNSVLGVIHRNLLGSLLEPIYKKYEVIKPGETDTEYGILIESIVGLGDVVKSHYKTDKLGLLVFINDEEPMKGEISIDSLKVYPGDEIKLLYVCLMANKHSDNQQLTMTFD